MPWDEASDSPSSSLPLSLRRPGSLTNTTMVGDRVVAPLFLGSVDGELHAARDVSDWRLDSMSSVKAHFTREGHQLRP